MVAVTLQIRPITRGTYTLRSTSFEGLRIAMNRRPEWGLFDPHINYDFESETDMVSTIILSAAPEITLPAWSLRATADDAHAQAWDAMLAALTQHEENHLRIFERWVQTFRRNMRRVRPFPASEFESRCDGFNDSLDTAQGRYDDRTTHGQREGVRLDDPPA
jgi:predicted secreted Zn-dependent protease